MTGPNKLYSGAYEWDLDESGSEESAALAQRSAEDGVTVYGKVDGHPATAFRGATYLRGEHVGSGRGSTDTAGRIAEHLDS